MYTCTKCFIFPILFLNYKWEVKGKKLLLKQNSIENIDGNCDEVDKSSRSMVDFSRTSSMLSKIYTVILQYSSHQWTVSHIFCNPNKLDYILATISALLVNILLNLLKHAETCWQEHTIIFNNIYKCFNSTKFDFFYVFVSWKKKWDTPKIVEKKYIYIALTLGRRLIQNLLVDRCLHLQLWHKYNSLSANSSSLVKLLKQSKKNEKELSWFKVDGFFFCSIRCNFMYRAVDKNMETPSENACLK